MNPIMLEYDHEILNSSCTDKKALNLTPALMKSINRIIQSEGYITHSIYGKTISTGGGNYMSLLKEVNVKGKTACNNKETNLFIKQCLPESDKNLMPPQDLFLREKFVYTELVNVFADLQNKFDVPDAEKYNIVKCYNDDNSDSLILENMAKQGFKIYNRLDVTPLKAIELSVAEIAKFHALSLVLKQYKPDYFRNKIHNWKHPFIFNDDIKTLCSSICNISMEILEDNRKLQVEKIVPELLQKYDRYLHENGSKTKCLCHGDFRMNNILVKEIDDEATKVIPLDFQLLYYGSPVLDLIYIIFTSTDQQLRKSNMENLKRVYFESLRNFLQFFSIDVESVFPQEEFENDFKNQLDYGLITSLVVLPFILNAEDEIPQADIELKKIKLHEKFKPRLQEIIDDFNQWGYF